MPTAIQNKMLVQAIKEKLPSNFKTMGGLERQRLLFNNILPQLGGMGEAVQKKIGLNYVSACKREAESLTAASSGKLKRGKTVGKLLRAMDMYGEAAGAAEKIGNNMLALQLRWKATELGTKKMEEEPAPVPASAFVAGMAKGPDALQTTRVMNVSDEELKVIENTDADARITLRRSTSVTNLSIEPSKPSVVRRALTAVKNFFANTDWGTGYNDFPSYRDPMF